MKKLWVSERIKAYQLIEEKRNKYNEILLIYQMVNYSKILLIYEISYELIC